MGITLSSNARLPDAGIDVHVPDAGPVMPTCLVVRTRQKPGMLTLLAVSAIQDQQRQLSNPVRHTAA
jgi:hypothetical protein